MLEIPKRLSLSAQATFAIRKGIDEQTWRDYLPSERRLCEILQVSRPTVRAALHLLSEEGLLRIRQGRRSRILKRSKGRDSKSSRVIGFLLHQQVAHSKPMTYHTISQLRARLSEQGFATEVLICKRRSAQSQRRMVTEFVERNRIFCSLLVSVTQELQLWFSEHSIPALVLGSCHKDVRLPSLDLHQHSVCRHAAGVFLSKGHRRIALIIPNSGVAGDLASEEGFKEGIFQRPDQNDVSAMIIRHDGSAKDIASKLDTRFNSASPPTALLVARPEYLQIVIMYLLNHGFVVPDTVSLIARDSDHHFRIVRPQITHYSLGYDILERRLSRLMLQLVRQGHLPPEPTLIVPTYVAGGTVKQLG